MKKIICLIILKFFLFTATTAIAGCNDDTDRSWSWTKSSNLTWDRISQTSKFQYTTKQNARYMVWTFKNKTNNKIVKPFPPPKPVGIIFFNLSLLSLSI